MPATRPPHPWEDAMVVRTPRLLMRPHRREDAAFMVELNSDPQVTRYVVEPPGLNVVRARRIIRSLQRQFRQRGMGRFMVLEAATGQRLGWCGLKWLTEEEVVDLGYRLPRRAWGQGLATEAARGCMRYGFRQLGLTRMIARVMDGNDASIRVLCKLGFVYLGTDHQGELLFERRRAQRPGL